MTVATISAKPKQVRDANASKQAMLDAAEELFGRYGFAAVSMRDVARLAGVSQPLIHFHFVSKQQLYTQVKRRVIMRYGEHHPIDSRQPLDPRQLRDVLSQPMDFFLRNQSLMRLCAWSKLEDSDGAWPGEAELMRAFVQQVRLGQEQGLIRSDVQPLALAVMMFGCVYFWVDNRQTYMTSESDPSLPGGLTDEMFLDQLALIFRRAITPPMIPKRAGQPETSIGKIKKTG